MRSLSALCLLVAMTMPYARAPLCQAGQHEHPAEEHGMHHDGPSVDGGEDAESCHEQMLCDVFAEVSVASTTAARESAHAPFLVRRLALRTPRAVRPPPASPPPRSV